MRRFIHLVLLSIVLTATRVFATSWVDIQNIYSLASRGDIYSLRALKDQGFSLDIEDDDGNTPYCIAVHANNQLAVKTLQLAGADTSPWCMWHENIVTESMIYEAADDQNTQRIAYWQKHGIPVDVMDQDSGNTALCEAVYERNCKAIDVLIKAGANQYHPCLQRIPDTIRRSLNCQPVIRDWSKVGMTILGLGLVGGGVAALAGSGGGKSSKAPCGAGEHWDGEQCVHCKMDEYWDSNSGCARCPPDKPHSNGTVCLACSLTQVWNVAQMECKDCPTGYHAENNICVACDPNYIWTGESCTPCPRGQHGDGLTCATCANGTYWDGTQCTTCPISENRCDIDAVEYYDLPTDSYNRCPKYVPDRCGSGAYCNGTHQCEKCMDPMAACGIFEQEYYPNTNGQCPMYRNVSCNEGSFCNAFNHCTECAPPIDACDITEPIFQPNTQGRCPVYNQITCAEGSSYCSADHRCVACQPLDTVPGDCRLTANRVDEVTRCITTKKTVCSGGYPLCSPDTGLCEACPGEPTYDCAATGTTYWDGSSGRCPKVVKDTCREGVSYCAGAGQACTACPTNVPTTCKDGEEDETDAHGCYTKRKITCGRGATCDQSTGRCVECSTDTDCGAGGHCIDQTCTYCTNQQCWDGHECLDLNAQGVIEGQHSSDDPAADFIYGRYRRASDGSCQRIAPSAVTEPPSQTHTYFSGLEEFSKGGNNFLSAIQAQYAYERGYNGTRVTRSDKWGDGEEATSTKVKVGLISSGVNTTKQLSDTTKIVNADGKTYKPNTDLKQNLSSKEFNFDYGKCNGANNTWCYGEVAGAFATDKYLVFYMDDATKPYYVDAVTYKLTQDITTNSIRTTSSGFADYWQNLRYVSGYTIIQPGYQDEGKVDYHNNANPHYTVYSGTSDSQDNAGTSLAGIIAAAKDDAGMMGVAYNAEIIPAIQDIFRPYTSGSTGTGSTNAISALMTEKATVILQDSYLKPGTNYLASNYTRTQGTAEYDAFQVLAGQNKTKTGADQATVLVLPTGNYANNVRVNTGEVASLTYNDASWTVGAPQKISTLKDVVIAVTGVVNDSSAGNGFRLADNALPCGTAGNYCLSAPATAKSTISTTSETRALSSSETTSTANAAAVVAGAIAVMQGAYSHLTTPEIMKILYTTATPLGALATGEETAYDKLNTGDYGQYSSLYGYGLVNLRAATEPIGELWVNPSYSAARTAVKMSSFTGSNTASSILSMLPETMMAYDSYERAYPVSLKGMLKVQGSERNDLKEDFDAFMQGRDKTTVQASDQFSMSYATHRSEREAKVPYGLMEMAINFGPTKWNLFYTEDALNARSNSYFERVLNNPLVQIHDAHGFESAYQLNSKFAVTAGYMAGKNGFLGDGDKDFDAPDNRLYAYQVGMAYQPSKSITFKTAYGVLNEQDSILGMMGEGAFDVKGATTSFVSAGLSINPIEKMKLDLMYTYGWTNPQRADGIMQFSKLTSDGFAMTAQYDLGDDSILGLSVSSPLKVRSGKVSVDIPVGRDETRFYSQRYIADLKPTARELAFALYYKDALSEDLQVQSEVGMRIHPDHQADAKNDYRGMFGLNWNY